MAIKQYNPTTPARRKMTTKDMSGLTKARPQRKLSRPAGPSAGRNNQGRITVRHRGGGVKRRYRIVDFKQLFDAEYTVTRIEYDPSRSANVALVEAENGKKAYVLAGRNMKPGEKLSSSSKAPIRAGNRMPLSRIPLGSEIYNIEINLKAGGQLVRSAGTKAQLVAKEGDYAQIRMPSGEIRLINKKCYATMGSVGNEAHQNIVWGSAGRRRRLGWRPSVRGKAMNPVDHPMGGGEGQSSPGRLPRTPWGKIAIGPKTRRRKYTNKMIVSNRKSGRR
jgi:large subunit ribosomal protein L2